MSRWPKSPKLSQSELRLTEIFDCAVHCLQGRGIFIAAAFPPIGLVLFDFTSEIDSRLCRCGLSRSRAMKVQHGATELPKFPALT